MWDFGRKKHGFLAFNDIQSDYYQIPTADKERLKEVEEKIREDLKNINTNNAENGSDTKESEAKISELNENNENKQNTNSQNNNSDKKEFREKTIEYKVC